MCGGGTGDVASAWRYLTKAHSEEMSKRKFSSEIEVDRMIQLAEQTQAIFRRGFWPIGVGSESKSPIFIVGMMRCRVCLSTTRDVIHLQLCAPVALGRDQHC